MKLNLAVCDDEAAEIEYLSSLVEQWSSSTGNVVALKSFASAESFLFEYEENKNYDILLLDIQMKEIDGIELAKEVRKYSKDTQIVFVTGYEKYISYGYDVAALHYLMKPVSYEKISEVLSRAADNLGKTSPAILINANGENLKLFLSDIYCVEAVGHTLKITCADGDITVNQSLSSFKSNIGNDFISTHRSFIVNLEHIKRISKTDVILDNGKSVPVSRRMYDDINRAFVAYYRR